MKPFWECVCACTYVCVWHQCWSWYLWGDTEFRWYLLQTGVIWENKSHEILDVLVDLLIRFHVFCVQFPYSKLCWTRRESVTWYSFAKWEILGFIEVFMNAKVWCRCRDILILQWTVCMCVCWCISGVWTSHRGVCVRAVVGARCSVFFGVWRRLVWIFAFSRTCVCFLSISHSDVCPPTGQCPNGLSCFPSISLCKYSGSASDSTRTRLQSRTRLS